MVQFTKLHQSLSCRSCRLVHLGIKEFNFEVITSKCQVVAPALGSKLSPTFRRRVRNSPSSAIFEVMRQESFDCGHTVNASISSSAYTWSFALGLISSPQIDALSPPGPRKCLLSVVMDVTALVLLSVVSPDIWTFLSTINLTSWGSHFHSDSWFLLVF